MTGVRTIKGTTAIVGIGETTYYKRGQAPDPEFVLGWRRSSPPGDAGHRLARHRRLRVLQQRPQRPGAGSRRARAARAALLQHAVGRRRRRRLGGRRQRRRRRSRPAIADTSSSTGRSPRASSAASARRRDAGGVGGPAVYALPYGVLSPAQMFAMRMHALHARARRRQEALQTAVAMASYHHAQTNPRAVMYGRPLTEEAYDDVALDRRAVPSLRLLHGERRRRRADPRPRPSAPRTCASRRRTCWARPRAPSDRDGAGQPQRARLRDLELQDAGAAPVRDGRRGAAGRRRRAELRELHRRRRDEPDRARLLRARGGQRVLHASRT